MTKRAMKLYKEPEKRSAKSRDSGFGGESDTSSWSRLMSGHGSQRNHINIMIGYPRHSSKLFFQSFYSLLPKQVV